MVFLSFVICSMFVFDFSMFFYVFLCFSILSYVFLWFSTVQ
jgi:hypothetical protein